MRECWKQVLCDWCSCERNDKHWWCSEDSLFSYDGVEYRKWLQHPLAKIASYSHSAPEATKCSERARSGCLLSATKNWGNADQIGHIELSIIVDFIQKVLDSSLERVAKAEGECARQGHSAVDSGKVVVRTYFIRALSFSTSFQIPTKDLTF